MSTIFSKIIAGEVPCTKVFEDDVCLAFLDNAPITKGHTLVITKEEFPRMTDVPDELVWYAFMVAKDIMQAMKDSLWCDYVMVHVEGNQVPHFHIHLIPSRNTDKVVEWKHGEGYSENEASAVAEKIAWKLSQNT